MCLKTLSNSRHGSLVLGFSTAHVYHPFISTSTAGFSTNLRQHCIQRPSRRLDSTSSHRLFQVICPKLTLQPSHCYSRSILTVYTESSYIGLTSVYEQGSSEAAPTYETLQPNLTASPAGVPINQQRSRCALTRPHPELHKKGLCTSGSLHAATTRVQRTLS